MAATPPLSTYRLASRRVICELSDCHLAFATKDDVNSLNNRNFSTSMRCLLLLLFIAAAHSIALIACPERASTCAFVQNGQLLLQSSNAQPRALAQSVDAVLPCGSLLVATACTRVSSFGTAFERNVELQLVPGRPDAVAVSHTANGTCLVAGLEGRNLWISETAAWPVHLNASLRAESTPRLLALGSNALFLAFARWVSLLPLTDSSRSLLNYEGFAAVGLNRTHQLRDLAVPVAASSLDVGVVRVPLAMHAGDLNGDGWEDLAAVVWDCTPLPLPLPLPQRTSSALALVCSVRVQVFAGRAPSHADASVPDAAAADFDSVAGFPRTLPLAATVLEVDSGTGIAIESSDQEGGWNRTATRSWLDQALETAEQAKPAARLNVGAFGSDLRRPDIVACVADAKALSDSVVPVADWQRIGRHRCAFN